MFTTMQRIRNRPKPTGRARVVRTIVLSLIALATLFVFESMQFSKLSASLDYQYKQITDVNANMTPQLQPTLAALQKKFGSTDKFLADPALSAAPMADRTGRSAEQEILTAKHEAWDAEHQVFLYDLVKWVVPGAVAAEDAQDKRIADVFHGPNYMDLATVNEKIMDVTAGVQHCQGTPLDPGKGGAGYTESPSLGSDELAKRAGIIDAAADRTMCSAIPKLSKH